MLGSLKTIYSRVLVDAASMLLVGQAWAVGAKFGRWINLCVKRWKLRMMMYLQRNILIFNTEDYIHLFI